MNPTKIAAALCSSLLLVLAAPGSATAANLKAEYNFGNTLASSLSGTPALASVAPAGASAGFVTDTVFGESRTVYATSGTASIGINNQAGLTLETFGLVASNSYSVEMVFSMTDGYALYKRILQTGTNDNGLYVDPMGKLNTYSGGGNAGLSFALGTYHHLIATVSTGGETNVWLDGTLSQRVSTTALNIAAPSQTLGFYLDENIEFANAKTALIRVWDAPLSNAEVTALNAHPLATQVAAVPEPETYAMLLAGLGLVGAAVKRRKATPA